MLGIHSKTNFAVHVQIAHDVTFRQSDFFFFLIIIYIYDQKKSEHVQNYLKENTGGQ